MEKKFYIQPQSKLLTLQGQGLCQGNLTVGSNGDPKDNVWGTPQRGFSGESQGLKYLI